MNKSCIFCPYKHEEDCTSHDKCYALSNLYYGKIVKLFPFNIIDKAITKFQWWREDVRCRKADEKYGSFMIETDDIKFIWGVKSWDDITGCDSNLYTMNDIDITYDKNIKKYFLGIETAYKFEDGYSGECKYLNQCLEAFAQYMDNNGLSKNESYMLFMNNPCTSLQADTIEELYTNFRIFVNGFCSLRELLNKNSVTE